MALSQWLLNEEPEKPREGNGKAAEEANELIRNTAYKFSSGGDFESLIASVLFALSGAIQGGYLSEFQAEVIDAGDKLCLEKAFKDQAERESFSR